MTSRPVIARRAGDGPAPLSFAQERLWYLDQIEPGDPAGNISRAVRLRGELDHERLPRALAAVVQAQDSLRVTFATSQLHLGVDGQPKQLTSPESKVRLEVVDLSLVDESQRLAKAREVARTEAQRGFDLNLGPLLRVSLLKLGEDDHVLLVVAHRIISDDHSLDIFFRELWAAYEADEGSSGQPLLVQFEDYAVWQRESLTEERLAPHLDYWRDALGGAPALIELSTDRPRPPVQSSRGGSFTIALENEQVEALSSLAESVEASLFSVLMGAFQVLLARYSRQDDFVVGSELLNNEFLELANVIGPRTDTVALRVDLSGNPTFRQLMKRIEHTVAQAKLHRLMPFEKLVNELEIERNLSFAPLFQTSLSMRATGIISVAGLMLDEFEFDSGVCRYDLGLNVSRGKDVKLRFEYRSELFDRETIERMANQFLLLLTAVTSNPGARISTLPLLNRTELNQVLYQWNNEWNNTGDGQPATQCVHELFALSAQNAPNAVALISGEAQLTYAELNSRANQLARLLIKRGVGPDQLVAVYLDRSVANIVALLAVLKAGGAYVPIDPAYPQDRVTFMLADSKAAVIITQQNLAGKLGVQPTSIVLVDGDQAGDRAAISNESSANPVTNVAAENLAYVIYTSGSTGQPKGVAIEHRAVVTFLQWALKTFSIGELERVLHATSFCFDLSVFELFAPLCAGGTVVLAANALQLIELKSAGITLVNTVPSAMTELVRMGGLPESVRTINLAGEPLLQGLVNEIYKNSSVKSVYNLYGPSEDTTYSTFTAVESAALGEPSIGRPITNSSAYILDQHQQPAPVGVPGELYLSGAGLARGYLNRPELTAEKFVPNPFSTTAGARMYRTGDLARYRPGGDIDFLGRIDNQVKLRGFRIELGEIEATLRQLESVAQAVVMVREDQPGDKRLVAYVVSGSGSDVDTSSLKKQLAQSLPDFMIPSAFVFLNELPLTPNGKTDRKALPRPDSDRSGLKSSFVAPRDNLEQQLANILKKILDLKTIGVRDSFFDLGGHSLHAVRLFAQIENRFSKRLPLVTLFRAPTIEQLATVLRASEASNSWSSLVPIQPLGTKPPLFCIHAAGANVLIYRPLSRHLGNDQPVYALQARGLDGQQQPFLRVEEMAAHYIREMRAFQPEGPYNLLGASFGGLVIFEMAMQLAAQGQQVGLLAMLNTNCPVYPRSKKIRFHLTHLKQYGPGFYSRAMWQSVQRKMGKPTVSVAVSAAPDPALARLVADRRNGDEALIRTVTAILDAEKEYIPRGKTYRGKITLFWARDDETDFEDNRMGWDKLASEGLEVHVIPGTHISIREEPHVAALAEKLSEHLNRMTV
jgi:amino acid adenylation domain-containing protein